MLRIHPDDHSGGAEIAPAAGLKGPNAIAPHAWTSAGSGEFSVIWQRGAKRRPT